MKICVIGAGYVGLVTAACFADFGNQVICVDKDPSKIANLKKGMVEIHELGLADLVRKNQKEGRLNFSGALPQPVLWAELIFVAVGTPPLPDGSADTRAIDALSRQLSLIFKKSRGFKVLALKSTIPVGITREVTDILKAGGVPGKNCAVVTNPEFLREGKAVADFLHPDRIIIGGAERKARELMSELYRPLNSRIIFMDAKSAEMVKYASNAFLAGRVSLLNEIANICERVGADIKKVAEGVGHDSRIGQAYLKPGIGYGGSCLPKDILALIHLAKQQDYDAQMLKSISQTNLRQRRYFSEKAYRIIKQLKGKKIGIWGLAFKPLTDDLRDAPALEVIKYLLEKGLRIKAYDPAAMAKARKLFPRVKYCRDPYEAARDCDAVLVLTEWNEFREIDLKKFKERAKHPVLIDGRNIFSAELMRKHGIKYYGIGF